MSKNHKSILILPATSRGNNIRLSIDRRTISPKHYYNQPHQDCREHLSVDRARGNLQAAVTPTENISTFGCAVRKHAAKWLATPTFVDHTLYH